MQVSFTNLFLLFGVVAVYSACSPRISQQQYLQQAADIHMEAVEIGEAVAARLDTLIQLRNSLSIQGRALAAEEIAFIGKVDDLETDFRQWQDNHVHAPEFIHRHREGQAYEHGTERDVSPKKMLQVQKAYRETIAAIQQRANVLQVP